MINPVRRKPWLWVVLAFAVQIGVWAAWITLASKNKVAEVPLQARPSQRAVPADR